MPTPASSLDRTERAQFFAKLDKAGEEVSVPRSEKATAAEKRDLKLAL